jgi:hypothetical protein
VAGLELLAAVPPDEAFGVADFDDVNGAENE